ncbi:MAG: diaminopimelate decarboxylase [Syntrophaceae bacterium]|nr:diaminopimelate decarboxylase [Syntrophaceae bacterium]
MNEFIYKNNQLYCESVALETIAKSVGTPFYVYSYETLKRHFRVFDSAFTGLPHLTCFAVKSNSNIAILRLFIEEGGGVDIVSGGELYRAVQADVDPKKVVYSGVGKKTEEIEYALQTGILMFNVESSQELEAISACAKRIGKTAGIALRINPDVDAQTHPHISTGMKENKFGIDIEKSLDEYRRARALDNIEVIGVSCHIGSQITKTSPFIDALKRLKTLLARLQEDGFDIRYLDLGGGLGITYKDETPPHPTEYAEALLEFARDLPYTFIFEPGRVVVGNAGALVTRVLFRKNTGEKDFVIVDAGMNDLVRPSLYDSYHRILPVAEQKEGEIVADVVGPICESGDFLAKKRKMADVGQGALIAVMSAGAYGFSMSSNYNSRPRVAEVLVRDDKYYVIRKRETYEDLVRGEVIPEFQK